MPKLTVINNDIKHEIPFPEGSSSSVCELLDGTGLWIRTGCQGNGACGLCLVQIISGNTNCPTKSERLTLSRGQLDGNVRLACQLTPVNDVSIRIIGTASTSGWRDLASIPCTPEHLPVKKRYKKTVYGLAVDVGTTHISISLWDLKLGRRLSARMGVNPQECYGTDVVTRLIAAGQSRENARRLRQMVFDAIHYVLLDICSRNGINPEEVVHVVFVGNTPMLTLLTESNPGLLLQPAHWTQPIHCCPDDPRSWSCTIGINPRANIDVASPLAGFVGSDLLAGVVATRLMDHPGGLLIDFGTNSEMALWDGKTLWVTSAAGGPAFEGGQAQCGMPAEAGAIYNVDMGHDPLELNYNVIGGGYAKGVCGSGLIDLIAILKSRGDLTATGKFMMPDARDGFVVQENPPIRLTRRDVDMFQRAKAAIGVGIKTLLARAKMSIRDLSHVYICGAFGQNLDIRNAQAIGLLPETPLDNVNLCGNTALAGCERLLLSQNGSSVLKAICEQATIINLSQSPDFDSLFMESLYLQPLRVEGV